MKKFAILFRASAILTFTHIVPLNKNKFEVRDSIFEAGWPNALVPGTIAIDGVPYSTHHHSSASTPMVGGFVET